jgi:hypothetical protein
MALMRSGSMRLRVMRQSIRHFIGLLVLSILETEYGRVNSQLGAYVQQRSIRLSLVLHVYFHPIFRYRQAM